MARGIVKLLFFGFVGISGIATVGGIIFKSSNGEKSAKQEIIAPIRYTNSDKVRKYNIDGSADGSVDTECRAYWIEGVTYNIETAELGFDKLRGNYSNSDKDKFFNEAKISQSPDIRTNHPFDFCDNGQNGYFYLWPEETKNNEWRRQKGRKLDDSIVELELGKIS